MSGWRMSHRATPGERALVVQSCARSHVGLRRAINEDRVFEAPEHGLWVVADGMGGHHGGDLAAQAIVDAFRALVEHDEPIDRAAMLAAVRTANGAIVARNRAMQGDAGSTVVAAHISGASATIAWVGDSRAYLIRGGYMAQMTRDHSVVQDLIDAGLLPPDRAAHHPQANVVTRALGVADAVEIATVELDLAPGDCLLLCSDGLSRSLRPDALCDDQPLATLADRLLSEALRRDGSDNISLVLVRVESTTG